MADTKKPGKTRPGVERGDEVYFKSGDQHTHGRVVSHGAHGCHIDHAGGRSRVYWEDILGHKSRSAKSARVIDQGDDGFLMEDDHGRRRFVAGEAPKPDETPGDHDAVLEHVRRATPLAKAAGALELMLKAHVGPYQHKRPVLMRKSIGAESLISGVSRTSVAGISGAETAPGRQTDPGCSSRWLPAPHDAVQPMDAPILFDAQENATFEDYFEMYKSISPDADEPRLLFFKGGPLANRLGLTQKKITDKAGHQTTRWVRTSHDAPANDNGGTKDPEDKRGAAAGYGTHDIQPGSRVKFQAGEHRGEGEVTAVGEHGLTAKDGTGREHQVLHHEVTHFKPGEDVKQPAVQNTVLGEQKPIPAADFTAADYAKSHDQSDVSPESVLANFPEDTGERIKAAQDRLAGIEQTIEQFKKDGKWAAQREVLHHKILSDLLSPEKIAAATPADGEKPKFVILGGRGGSGKSSFAGAVYDPAKSIVLDADHIKGLIPEYEGWNASAVHEESGEIFDTAVRLCRELGLNTVLDKTMKTAKSAMADVQAFKDAGYRTEAHYMHLPRQEAAKRAVGRFLGGGEKGRYVPVEVVLGNTTNESAFDQVKGMVDAWSFRDNNVPKGSKPILISQSGDAPAAGGSAPEPDTKAANKNAPASAPPPARAGPSGDAAPNLRKSLASDTMILLFRRK